MNLSGKFRMTSQRQLILELVSEGKKHRTADEIYQEIKKKLPRISLGTVYRNLDILAEQGLVKKMGPVESQRRFDGNLEPHHHLRCLICGKVEDVPMINLEGIQQSLAEQTRFDVLGFDIEFSGICPDCRALNDVDQ